MPEDTKKLPPDVRSPDVRSPKDQAADSADAAAQHLILVPVEAEDVARTRRGRFAILWLVVIVLVGAAALLYKRSVDPIHAQESYELGVRMLSIEHYSQAIIAFDRAISLQSSYPDAYLMRARALVADNQTERAIRDFTKAIEVRPSDPQPLIERGKAYIDLKDYQAAITDANAAVGIDTNLNTAYNLRGTAIRAMGNPQGALADFTHAVALAPNAANYFDRGSTYQMLGQDRLAVADFNEVIAFTPDTAAGYFARAKSKRAIGDFAGAQRDHDQGRKLDGR